MASRLKPSRFVHRQKLGSKLPNALINTSGWQIVTETQTVGGVQKWTSTTNDIFGRPLQQSFPNGGAQETLNYAYNPMGLLSGLSGANPYLSNVTYNAAGQVSSQQIGTALKQINAYNSTTQRLTSTCIFQGSGSSCPGTPSAKILSLSFGYQNNGNISQIDQQDQGRNETMLYTYDELDRLLTAGGINPQQFRYSPSGNLMTVTDTVQASYQYDPTHIHAVTTVTRPGGSDSYQYDADGNMTLRVEAGVTYNQVFDAENRLVSVTSNNQTTQFFYDGQGNQVVKRVDPDTSYTVY